MVSLEQCFSGERGSIATLGYAIEYRTEEEIVTYAFPLGNLFQRMTGAGESHTPALLSFCREPCGSLRVACIEMNASQSHGPQQAVMVMHDNFLAERKVNLAYPFRHFLFRRTWFAQMKSLHPIGKQRVHHFSLAWEYLRHGDYDDVPHHAFFCSLLMIPPRSKDASQSFHTGSLPSSFSRQLISLAVLSSETVNCSSACG